MGLALKIGTTHTITVQNILDANGDAPSTITSVTAKVLDREDVELATTSLSETSPGVYQGNIAPTMVEGRQYFLHVIIVADGVQLTERSGFVAGYIEAS